MLKLVNITKEYKVEEEITLALNEVSIEFRKNEFVSILGPSGCGKTTLLNIIGGLDRYTDGDIQVDGISTKQYDDVDWDTYRNRRIGFVFQSYNLIPHMNILRNVAMSLTLAGIDRDERRRRALEALEKVGLADQARKKPSQLSGGQAQRVAIARALVNNPEIILADEPTGALDSESGIQVMDLLKEVAKDRLVIMVTHNPSLADEYSTRIVYLKDGQVVGDTMPYNAEAEVEEVKEEVVAQEVESVDAKDEASVKVASVPQKLVKKQSKLAQKLAKIRHADKSSMKLSTAIQLSWNNLLAKKGRTLLTSIAGSIGIIGIILVLALSTGASNYIASLEESSLSSYPLTISRSNGDLTAILSTLMSNDGGEREEHPDTEAIYTNQMLGKVISELGTLMKTNDLEKLKTYIDANFDKDLARVKYNYGVNFNAFIEDPINKTLQDPSEHRYMKVNPYQEVMDTVLKNLPDNLMGMQIGGMSISEALAMFTQVGGAGMMSSWAEMPSAQDGSLNLKMLESQYELVGESRWPQSATEVVIVVDSRNQLLDYQFFMLGLVSQDEVFKAIMDQDWADRTTSVEELLSLEYKILGDSDYLIDNGDDTWTMHNRKEQNKNWIDSRDPLIIDVVGVIRPKKGVTVTSINGVLGYMPQLTDLLLEKAENHPAIKEMEARKAAAEDAGENKYYGCINYAVADGHTSVKNNEGDLVDLKADYTYIHFDDSKDEHATLLRQFGYADTSNPVSIEFFCYSFEAKQKIKDFIDEYNRQGKLNTPEGEEFTEISVSDGLSVIMSFVNTMATTITGVLVAFAAISLVVSTIMIAIIIYTSVLERRKEIGVLRSIGARKKDIARVFLAESAILGGYSGLIGIIISVIFSFAVSALLEFLVGIPGLMAIGWWQCLMMFAISIGLSMLAGFIPSRIAANKDPAIALRSE